jgi:pimeloyl-ACP methyl ester carboxylesterase
MKELSMKNRLSLGLIGCLSLALSACIGDDDDEASEALAPSGATNETESPAATEADAGEPREATSPAEIPAPPAPTDAAGARPEQPVAPALEIAEPSWRSCGRFQDRNLECAEVLVPVDYAAPDGEKLPIAMRRIVANPLEPYRGALLINPGGPGGAGIDFALQQFQQGIFEAIAPGFDIVGFDPRGVAASGERSCGVLPAEMYPALAEGEAPASAVQAFVDDLGAQGARCEAEWGALFRKLGSNNVVRDMEELRKALRQPVLNFYGGSYGTRLGALYAHEFPETVGRIVLDAPVHPRVNSVEHIRNQFQEVLAVQEQLLAECEAGALPECPLDARALFEQMLANATTRDLRQAFISLWRDNLDSVAGLDVLLTLFANEVSDPGGDWLEAYLTGGGPSSEAGTVALLSVTCTDDTIEPPTLPQIESVVSELTAASPIFSDTAILAGMCAGWPATRDPVPLPTALDAREPLLVIGGRLDWRTPYAQAQAMTETLGKATLFTSNHFGHGALVNPTQCAVDTIRAFLTTGSLPPAGAACE